MSILRNLYYGRVIDNNDPLMLGRIRIHPEHENLEPLKNSNPNFNENANNSTDGKWSKEDPLVFLPFLPYYINPTPQIGERVIIVFYDNLKQNIKDKFYLVGPYSSPTATLREEGEDFDSSRTHLNSGRKNSQIKWPDIKNLENEYKESTYNGIFAEPSDVAIKGRGSTDLILKNNDVLLRAGKNTPFIGGEIPNFNHGRAFLQLSQFNNRKVFGEEKTFYRLKNEDKQIKYLIEYDVYNPESIPEIFTGNITIYQLPEKEQKQTKVKSFDYDTKLTGFSSSIVRISNIDSALPLSGFSKFVSDEIITMVNNPSLLLTNLPNGTTFSGPTSKQPEQFPFYYRPSERIRNILKTSPGQSSIDLKSFFNMQKLVSKINVSTTDLSPGYGLIFDRKLSPEIPFTPVKEKIRDVKTEEINNSVGLLGANYLYLLSNESTINGKPKINFSELEQGPKITQNDIDDIILKNTSSMVRGEELLDLLNLIVQFLISHVHPYPLLPPSSVTSNGQSSDNLLKQMLEAYNKVLNKNIRIN